MLSHRTPLAVSFAALMSLTGAGPGPSAGGTPRERLAAIESRQQQARERFGEGLKEAGQSAEAKGSASARYVAEVGKNVADALRLAREEPGDPATTEALRFVIKTNG